MADRQLQHDRHPHHVPFTGLCRSIRPHATRPNVRRTSPCGRAASHNRRASTLTDSTEEIEAGQKKGSELPKVGGKVIAQPWAVEK